MIRFSSCRFSQFRLKTRVWFLIISLLFSFKAFSDQSEATRQIDQDNTPIARLLVLGDSLSAAYGLRAEQGWVSLLQAKWQSENRSIEIINAAISGDTTDGGLARLPRLLDLHKPSHLYIELGGNNGLQGHRPAKIKQNIKQMIELAQSSNVKVILQEMQIPTNYGARYTEIFNKIYHDLSKQYEVPLIPFFLQDIALNESLMQNDGIHPTGEAQPLIVDFLSPKLLSAM